MGLFELCSKEKAFFICLIKLLFIIVRCLINVNKVCDLFRNGCRTTKWVICGRPSLNASLIFLYKSHSKFSFHPLK